MDPVPLEELIPPPEEINDTHKVYSIAVTCIILGVIVTLFVITRLVLRFRASNIGADDYAVIPSTILYLGWTALAAFINLNAGVGKPLWEITLGEYSLWFKGVIATAWLYPIMSGAIRVSIVLFYMRIFATQAAPVAKWILRILLALQGVYVVVFSILPGFICSPVHFAWVPKQRIQHCDDMYYFYTTVSLYSASLFFDIVLLVFPIAPVFKLQLPLKKRIAVIVMFMLGAAASVAAAYKLAIFVGQIYRLVPTDPTFLQYEVSLYIAQSFDIYGYTFWIPSQVEPTVALVGASLPALQPLLISTSRKIWGTIKGTTKSNSTRAGDRWVSIEDRKRPNKSSSNFVSSSEVELCSLQKPS